MDSRLTPPAVALRDMATAAAPVAFDALRDALSASYCLLFAERMDRREVEAPVVDGVDRAYGERLQLAAAESLLPTWLRHLGEGAVVDRAALARDSDFARSDFYNYVIRPEGRFHCLIATPHVTPSRRYHLIVGRPHRADDFSLLEMALLRALLPHVARLIAVTNDAAQAAERSSGLLAAFDSLSDKVLVVHPTAELAFANAGARRVLALHDGLDLSCGRLRAMDAGSTSALLAALALVTGPGKDDDVAVQLPRPSGQPPFQLRVRRIEGADGGPPGTGRRALLLIQQPPPETPPDIRSLARRYGLTPREADIALLLSQGCDLRAVASTLGMSYQTARFHLRNTFGKTDVRRQSDLIRMVLHAPAKPQLTRPV